MSPARKAPDVASWNVHNQNTLAETKSGLSALIAAGMDVIGCQEMSVDATWLACRTFMASKGYVCKAPNNAVPIYVGPEWEIVEHGNESLKSSAAPIEPSTAGGKSSSTMGYKSVTWVSIRHRGTGALAFVANTHIVPSIEDGGKLVHPQRLAWYVKQVQAVAKVTAAARKAGHPVAVTGDFNLDYDRAGSDAVKRMSALGLTACWASTKARGTHTTRTIDYVWHNVRARSVSILPKHGSDHSPVACDLTTSDDDTETETSMAFSPPAIKKLFEYVEKNLGAPVENGGILANKPGYHNSWNANAAGNYSKGGKGQPPADLRGDRNAASAIDITPAKAETQRALTARAMAFMKGDDPRAEPIREFFGSLDSRTVTGWSRWLGTYVSSDDSHEWHLHFSIYREYATDVDAMLGVAELICGVPLSQSKTKHRTTPAKPDTKPVPSKPPTTVPPVPATTVPKPPTSGLVYMDRLVNGISDSDSVHYLQQALIKAGAKGLSATGDFGPLTLAKVKEWQAANVTGQLTREEAARLFKQTGITVKIEEKS